MKHALALAMVLVALPASAQDAMLEQSLAHRVQVLEARLTRRPTPRDRCELGLMYQRQGRTDDAVRTLDQAVGELGAATAAADRRTLAACLYARGLAAEAASDVIQARALYVRSLELRETRETRERVEALSISVLTAADGPSRALAAMSREERAAAGAPGALGPDGTASLAVVAGPLSGGTVAWSLVATRSGGQRGLVAVACEAGGCHAAVVHGDASFGGHGALVVQAVLAHEGALELRTSESARTDAGVTVQRTAVYLCALEGATVTCGHAPVHDGLRRVTLDATYASGHVTLHRVAGRLPPTFGLPLDQPIAIDALPGFASDPLTP